MAAKPAKKAAKKAPAKKAASKAPAKKAPAKKAVKKATPKPAKKAAPKKAVKKATPKPAKKAPAKKAVKKVAPKKVVKKAVPKKAVKKAAPKPAAKKAPAKKAAAEKPVAKKVAEKKTAPAKVAPTKEAPKKEAKVAVAPAAPVPPPPPVINPIGGTSIPTVRKAVPGKKPAPKQLVVQEDESNWTKNELKQVQKILEREAAELELEIKHAEESFEELIFESGEGAGDDQADAGTKTFEREQEISLLANKRDLLDQTHHALERIASGTYGRCENCGKQIGKLRLLEANPRATLCMECRQREDRG